MRRNRRSVWVLVAVVALLAGGRVIWRQQRLRSPDDAARHPESGNAVPRKTRAWISGWQGDIAFTAVDKGQSGGTVDGPVAAHFLRQLGS